MGPALVQVKPAVRPEIVQVRVEATPPTMTVKA